MLPLLSLPSPLALLLARGGRDGWRGETQASSRVRDEREVPRDSRQGVPSSLNCRGVSWNTPRDPPYIPAGGEGEGGVVSTNANKEIYVCIRINRYID